MFEVSDLCSAVMASSSFGGGCSVDEWSVGPTNITSFLLLPTMPRVLLPFEPFHLHTTLMETNNERSQKEIQKTLYYSVERHFL